MTDDTSALAQLIDRFAVEPADVGEGSAAQPEYLSLVDWVELHLAHIVERRPRTDTGADVRSPVRWCASWWRHPEAVDRLAALWHAWEALRQDPATGMATWWLSYFDLMWAALTSEYGPMARCTTTTCAGPPPPLAVTPPPDGWLPPTFTTAA